MYKINIDSIMLHIIKQYADRKQNKIINIFRDAEIYLNKIIM